MTLPENPALKSVSRPFYDNTGGSAYDIAFVCRVRRRDAATAELSTCYSVVTRFARSV